MITEEIDEKLSKWIGYRMSVVKAGLDHMSDSEDTDERTILRETIKSTLELVDHFISDLRDLMKN